MRGAWRLEPPEATYVSVLHPRSGRARADEGHGLDHVVHRACCGLPEQTAHARRLDLEAAQGPGTCEQLACSRVVLVDAREVGSPVAEHLLAVVDHRQRAVSEQVHLHEAEGLDAVLLDLRHQDSLRRTLAGEHVGDRTGGDDDTTGMQAQVARGVEQCGGDLQHEGVALVLEGKAAALRGRGKGACEGVSLEPGRKLPQPGGGAALLPGPGRRWRALLERLFTPVVLGVPALVPGVVVRARRSVEGVVASADGPGQALRPAADLDRRETLCERRLAKGRAQAEAVPRRDHRRAFGAEGLPHVLDHLVAPAPAEVEVDVGAVLARGVEEAFERQAVAQGVGVGQLEAVGHEAVRGGAAAATGDGSLARVVRDARGQQEVGGEAELVDGGELEVQPSHDLGTQRGIAPPRSVEGQLAESRVGGLRLGELDLGEQHVAQGRHEAAALGHGERAQERPGNVSAPAPGRGVRPRVVGQRREELGQLLDGRQVGGALGQPVLREVAAQRVVLDRGACAVVFEAAGVGPVHVGNGEGREPALARALEQGLDRNGPGGGRDLGGLDCRCLGVGASLLPEAGGGDGDEELLGLESSTELDDESRMVDEHVQALAKTRERVDELEGLRTELELRLQAARVVAEPARGDELAQVGVAPSVTRQGHDASGPPGGIGDLRAEDRSRGACALGGFQQLHGSRERVHVAQGEGGEPEARGPGEQDVGRVESGEKGVPAVGPEGDVHRRSPPGGRSGNLTKP